MRHFQWGQALSLSSCHSLLYGLKTFLRIDGIQWGAAFAFNVVFSVFPIMILLVACSSFFVHPDRAVIHIVGYLTQFFPVGAEMKSLISDSIFGVVESRMYASVLAILILIWVAIQCYVTLIMVANQAEGNPKQGFWTLLLKSMSLLSITIITIFIGILIPVITNLAMGQEQNHSIFLVWGVFLVHVFAPLGALFLGLALLMKIVPNQAPPTRRALFFAGITALILQIAEMFFSSYLSDLSSSNAIYGAFGGAIAALFWIYFSGCVVILGICYCLGEQNQTRPKSKENWPKNRDSNHVCDSNL